MMNTLRLTPIYVLICAMGIVFNIAVLGFPQVLWIAGPVFMLAIVILSVPFFGRVFRALRTGDMPVPERPQRSG